MRGALVDPVLDGQWTNSLKADLSEGEVWLLRVILLRGKEEGCPLSGWSGSGQSPECARLCHCDNWADRKGHKRAIMAQEDCSWESSR